MSIQEEKESKFGIRLRRERERLGLTQQQFSDLVGVSRMTQGNYESGKRYPGEDYFDALEKLGDRVDRFYLFFGQREEDMTDPSLAVTYLLTELAEILEVERRSFLEIWEELTHSAGLAMATEDFSEVERLAKAGLRSALSKSPVILDENLLTEALEAVDSSIIASGTAVDAKKRNCVALMAYRQAKATGTLDRKLIDAAVALAR